MKTRSICLLALLAALGLSLFAAGCGGSGSSKETAAGASAKKYFCPMHPGYTSNRPGDCPICNMRLVPAKDGRATSAAPSGEAHAGHAQHGGGQAKAPKEDAVPGRIPVMISPDKQQLIGLKTTPVAKRELTRTIRATATVEHDERRLARIAPRFAGWVRDLKVNYTGQFVEAGQPLLTVYSPELFASENEYLLAYRRWQSVKDTPGTPAHESARRLLEASRRRLQLWQIADEEIRALEQSGEPKDELLLRAPVSGHVLSKAAVAGKAFMAGETLYEIADLSHLWLRAAVFEQDLPQVKVGQPAWVVLPYLGNLSYESQVTFLYPHVDPQTRRGEIRLELDNPEHRLRPGMWANVELEVAHGEVLAVPASAVIDTGSRFVAFVKRPDNHLEPREVKVGARTDDFYEVLAGVNAGEEVVTRALFSVDSESQLKAALAGMGSAGEHRH